MRHKLYFEYISYIFLPGLDIFEAGDLHAMTLCTYWFCENKWSEKYALPKGVNENFTYFFSFSIWFCLGEIHKTLLEEWILCELAQWKLYFSQVWHWISHNIIDINCLIWLKFNVRGQNIMFLSICEFRKNCVIEVHTFLTDLT